MNKQNYILFISLVALVLVGHRTGHSQEVERDSINFHFALNDPVLTPELSETMYQQLSGRNQIKLSQVDFGSRVAINELFNEGKVLTGGPLYEMVNEVGNHILESNNLNKDDFNFYVTTDDYANAYCFSTGDIFISVTLLARLENIEQLAFILSHELVHYLKQHAVQRYEKYTELKKASEREIKDYFSFSRDNEYEADLMAVDLFTKSSFDTSRVTNIFNLLELSFLPNGDYLFSPTDVNCEYFELNPTILNTDYPELEFDDKEISLYSTHPDAGSRKERVQSAINQAKLPLEGKIIRNQAKCSEQLSLARFYEVQVANQNRDFLDAIYLNYGLRREFKINSFLAEQEAISLANLQILYKTNEYSRYVRLPRFVKGPAHTFYAFFDKLKGNELSTLVLGRLYKLDDLFPNNLVIQECLSRTLSSENLEVQLPYNKKEEVLSAIDTSETSSHTVSPKNYTFSQAYDYWSKNKVGKSTYAHEASSSKRTPYYTSISLPLRTIVANEAEKTDRLLVVEPTSSIAVKQSLSQSQLRTLKKLEKRIESGIHKTLMRTPYEGVSLNGQSMARNSFDAADWVHIKQLEGTISESKVNLIPGNMRDLYERFGSYNQIMFVDCQRSLLLTRQPGVFWSSSLFPPMLAVSLNDLITTEITVKYYSFEEHQNYAYNVQGYGKIKLMNAIYNSFLELQKSEKYR